MTLLFFCSFFLHQTHILQVFAPALRAYLTGGDGQLKCFAKLQKEDIFASVDASVESLKQQLEIVRSIVQKATDAKVKLQEAASKEPTKFSTFKAAGGTIDDFFKGLEDRIGEHVDMFLTQEGCYITPCFVTLFLCFDRRSQSQLQKRDVR
jgi:hypothetical protein